MECYFDPRRAHKSRRNPTEAPQRDLPFEIDRQVTRAVSFLGHIANGANVSSVVDERSVRDVRIDRPPADSPTSACTAGEATRRWHAESRGTVTSAAASSRCGTLENCRIRISDHERAHGRRDIGLIYGTREKECEDSPTIKAVEGASFGRK